MLCFAGGGSHLPSDLPHPTAAEVTAGEAAGSFLWAEDVPRQMRVLQMWGTSGGRAVRLPAAGGRDAAWGRPRRGESRGPCAAAVGLGW